jgi:uncharacterized Zn-binding protein involved in type VI secretion
MGRPAANASSTVVATDTHIIMVPAVVPIPTPMPNPFNGTVNGGLVSTVNIGGQPAAVVGSTAQNTPHIPTGGPFMVPPKNQATILIGSSTVMIGGKPAARMGDTAQTCNDPADLPIGQVVAAGTVMIGG